MIECVDRFVDKRTYDRERIFKLDFDQLQFALKLRCLFFINKYENSLLITLFVKSDSNLEKIIDNFEYSLFLLPLEVN